jgi:exonuclease III
MVKRRRSRSSSRSGSPSKDNPLQRISPPPLQRNQKSSLKNDPEIEERFEILSWNVNGVSQFLKADTPKITSFFGLPPSASTTALKEAGLDGGSPLRKFLGRHGWPEVVCLQEVKISPQDSSTKIALERAANSKKGADDDGPAYTAHFSLPRDKYNAKGFGGKVHGVCTLIHTPLIPPSSTKEVNWDLEGRVLITDFPKWKLAIINGYWVNGTTKPYRSPETGAVVGTRHDRKREFHTQMLSEVRLYEGRGWHVMLIGDMNIAPSVIDGYPNLRLGAEHVRNRRDFIKKFLDNEAEGGMRGIDTFRHLHGGLRKYTYHGEKSERWGESCDRVDLGIASKSLVEGVRGALVGAQIWESVEERGESDHVPLSVVLDVGKLGDTGSGRERTGQ